METLQVLQELRRDVAALILTIKTELSPLPDSSINWKADPTSWSILECLEHLNRYARYYNAEIARALEKNRATRFAPRLQVSWLGKTSIQAVSSTAVRPAKTLKRMNPNRSSLSRETIDEFIIHQKQLLALLQQAEKVDVNRSKVRIEFFKLLSLTLGEALLFVVEHEKRHLQQALRVKKQVTEMAHLPQVGS